MTNPIDEPSSAPMMPQMESSASSAAPITREVARRILTIIDHGLTSGLGIQEPGKMCIEAAVCFGLNLPHGDDPACVAEPLRIFKIGLNDSDWSTQSARARGLRRLGLAQLGSRGAIDEKAFVERLIRLVTTKYLPQALRSAASVHNDPVQQAAMRAAATTCENVGTLSSCEAAEAAAKAADTQGVWAVKGAANAELVASSIVHAFRHFQRFIASDDPNWIKSALSSAADRVADAGNYAAGCADSTTPLSHDDDETNVSDATLGAFAEDVVQVLIQLNAPGCQWLELTETN